MRVTITTALVGGIGLLLIWTGLTDRHPADVIRAVLTGNSIPPAGSWGDMKAVGKGLGKGGKRLGKESSEGSGSSGGILV